MESVVQKVVRIGNIKISNNLPMVLIAGPCVLESREHAVRMAGELKTITDRLRIPFVFKSSFDKANRTSLNAKRGVNLYEGIDVFREIKEKFGVMTVTDIHECHQAQVVAEVVDMIQIPALLSRQTDLLIAASRTGLAVQIKKGQFAAPEDARYMLEKVVSVGNENAIICERGTSFGYHKLVNDMTGLPIMSRFGYPVVFDGTHSVQEPAGRGVCSGGNRELVPYLCKAALAIGVAGLYLEIHDQPDSAPCDGPNMLRLNATEEFLTTMLEFDALGKKHRCELG